MSERFSGLKKVPDHPAARLLAAANAKLATTLKSPANAPVSVVLEELESNGDWVDMLRLISVSLPPRECVWWACLAGRDVLGEQDVTTCLKAAETWVFEPSEDNRSKVQIALETVDVDDDTTLCATAALYAPGTLGPGSLAEHTAPAGAVSSACFGMNIMALDFLKLPIAEAADHLIDRGVDIARGGNGQSAKMKES